MPSDRSSEHGEITRYSDTRLINVEINSNQIFQSRYNIQIYNILTICLQLYFYFFLLSFFYCSRLLKKREEI